MSLSDKQKERIHYMAKIAREKQYHEEDIKVLLMLSCTVEMVKKFGSSDNALEKIIEIIKQSATSSACVTRVTELIE